MKVVYSYSVFLGNSGDIFYLYGCYIFKKKKVKKVWNNLESIKICQKFVFSVKGLKRALWFSNNNCHEPSSLTKCQTVYNSS